MPGRLSSWRPEDGDPCGLVGVTGPVQSILQSWRPRALARLQSRRPRSPTQQSWSPARARAHGRGLRVRLHGPADAGRRTSAPTPTSVPSLAAACRGDSDGGFRVDFASVPSWRRGHTEEELLVACCRSRPPASATGVHLVDVVAGGCRRASVPQWSRFANGLLHLLDLGTRLHFNRRQVHIMNEELKGS